MRFIRYFFVLAIILVGVTFATLNSESVTVDYYLAQMSIPLSLLLVIVFALGCMVGMFASLWLLLKAKILNYRLKQQLHSIEKEVEQSKSMPVRGKA